VATGLQARRCQEHLGQTRWERLVHLDDLRVAEATLAYAV